MIPVLVAALAATAAASSPTAEEHPWLPGDEPTSVSVGSPQAGHLVRGVRLPQEHPALRQLPTQAARGLDWGTDVTVRALIRAAEAVAQEFPGSVTWLGNLSRQGGGDIPWSSSHNSGRDADVAFHMLDPQGRPATRGDLVQFDEHGWAFDSIGALQFDVARNWVLVRRLLTDPESKPQYLFISDPLKALLLAEADRRKAPRTVIADARRILRQPGGKPPHDDHLHLRIHCTRADLSHGCRDAKPLRVGAVIPDRVRPDRLAKALGLLVSSVADVRRRAAWLLGLLNEPSTATRLQGLLHDEDARVRARAALSLVDLGARAKADALAGALTEEEDPDAAFTLAWALVELNADKAGAALLPMLDRTDSMSTGAALRGQIAGLLADAGHGPAAPRIMALLVDPAPSVRQAARTALTRLTNTDRGEEMASWHRWWEDARQRPRAAWLAQGFRAAGYDVPDDPDRSAGPTLAVAVGDEADFVSENARRTLMGLYKLRDRTNLTWGQEDAAWFWGMKTAP